MIRILELYGVLYLGVEVLSLRLLRRMRLSDDSKQGAYQQKCEFALLTMSEAGGDRQSEHSANLHNALSQEDAASGARSNPCNLLIVLLT